MDSDDEYDDAYDSEEFQEDVDDVISPEPSGSGVCDRKSGGDPSEVPFEVLSSDDVVQDMVNCITEVNTVVQLPPTVTRILLHHFKWDKERLYERYYDGDRARLFDEAHIVDPSTSRSPSSLDDLSSSSLSTTTRITRQNSRPMIENCVICCRDLVSTQMTGLGCGHRFCNECWTAYLTTKIMEEGMGNMIACANHGCDIIVDDQMVMSLITDSKVKQKYQLLITNSFVECNKLLRWCPKPECTRVIKVQHRPLDPAPVKCSCDTIFCFLCGENWHEPVCCDLLRKWKKKCDDDSETCNWIAANTKECPKCNVTIEKDGGCNHMICKNHNCKAEFCWICLGPWDQHGSSWYSCNRFDDESAKAARAMQEKSRAALQRYLHYCNRYMNHMQSLRFENKLYASIKEKMEEMQQHNMSWIEVQFLKKAVDVLCQCRQTLMYTYVFAYYLVKNNQSILFEDNQKDLESATETLSEYLERDITTDNIGEIKQKVQDKYRYCDTRRKVLLQHVQEGYDKDWWVYSVQIDKI